MFFFLWSRPKNSWTPERISSYIDCIQRPAQTPTDVDVDMTHTDLSQVAKNLENIERGKILKLNDKALTAGIQVPFGVAVTKVVKDIVDFVTKNVRNATKGYLAVVGPSGTGKSTAAQVAEQYCRAKNVFHVYVDDATILTKIREAETILNSMILFNTEVVWQNYGIEKEVIDLVKVFEANDKFPTKEHLLKHIIDKLLHAQRSRHLPVVCIFDNCQGVWKQDEILQLLKQSDSGRDQVRALRHVGWITPGPLLQGGHLVTLALASQHAKFELLLNKGEMSHLMKARIPMDPIDVVALKTVLNRVGFTALNEKEKWDATSKALATSGCVPRHAYHHLSTAKEAKCRPKEIFEPEGLVLNSIKSNVKRYLQGQIDLCKDANAQKKFGESMAQEFQSILGGNVVFSEEVVDSNPAIDFGILTPFGRSSFRYISQLHKRAHMYHLSFLGTGTRLEIHTHQDLEKRLINRIFAMGVNLSEGVFNGNRKCNLPSIPHSESSMELLYDDNKGVYYVSKGDQEYFQRLMCKPSAWTVMIYVPHGYISTDVFVLNRYGNTTTLYSIQITKDKSPANVEKKYNRIVDSVTFAVKALVGKEDISVDMVRWEKKDTLDVPFRAETRSQDGIKELKVVCILISPIEHSNISNGILTNNMVYVCGGQKIEREWFVQLKFDDQ